ncbi:sarcosine oxidase subunit gamma family protein [Xanthobacter sp. VNH20]|uniref:sarcosine oxidase subunit gamma n=1 Tax=Xanthobacter sp. VNH20 TaxID=3156616 RepID=UPI0032B52BBA
MSELLAEIPASAFVPEGRYGAQAGAPGVVASVISAVALAQVVVRRNGLETVAEIARERLGIALPSGPRAASAGDLTLIGTGPGRFLAVAEGITGDPLLARLAHAFGKAAALTDQSDGQVVIQLSGPRTSETLAKLVPVDLDPSIFKAGDAAATLVALIPLLIWQADVAPTYRFAVPRSFVPAFLRALVGAGGEFGIQLMGTGRG